MGVLFLFLSVLAGMCKMIAMKKCGMVASGPQNSLRINVIRAVGCTVISVFVCLFDGFRGMNELGLLCALLSGAFTAIFLFSWILSTQKASLPMVQVVCMLFGVAAPMILVPIISPGATAPTLLQWCGAIILIPASLCFSKKGGAQKKKTLFSALPLLLVMGISNGGSVTARKIYMDMGGGTAADFNLVTYLVASAILILLLLALKLRAKGDDKTQASIEKPSRSLFLFIGIAMVTLYLADYLNALASGGLPVQLLVPLSYIFNMPMTLASDVLFFKEKFTLLSALGILLVIASAILTSI